VSIETRALRFSSSLYIKKYVSDATSFSSKLISERQQESFKIKFSTSEICATGSLFGSNLLVSKDRNLIKFGIYYSFPISSTNLFYVSDRSPIETDIVTLKLATTVFLPIRFCSPYLTIHLSFDDISRPTSAVRPATI
jgi:hypothetical protein